MTAVGTGTTYDSVIGWVGTTNREKNGGGDTNVSRVLSPLSLVQKFVHGKVQDRDIGAPILCFTSSCWQKATEIEHNLLFHCADFVVISLIHFYLRSSPSSPLSLSIIHFLFHSIG